MAKIKIIQNTQRLSKDGCAPLYITFYLDREKVMLPCKMSIDIAKFNSEDGSIRGNTKEARDANLLLKKQVSKVNDILIKYRLRNLSLKKTEFIKEYNNPSDFYTFHDFAQNHMRNHSRKIEGSTLKHHMSCLKKFKDFNPDLQFHNITEEFISDYLHYMKKKIGNCEITAQRNLATIKIYVGAAYKKGYLQNNPFDHIQIKKVKSNIDYLTEDELSLIFTTYSDNNISAKIKTAIEFFLFMCLTSLHITDARNFRIEQILLNEITYFRVKNRNSKPEIIRIPLSKPAMNLIDNIKKDRESGYLFQKLPCDQVINRTLKEIATILEIDKKISAKTARHTFATIFLRKTKDVATLKELLGHSSLRETMLYAHVMDESKVEGMQCFNCFSF